MTPSERLKIAGDAAEILEEMGFVSVARLRGGVVTLECWERTDAPARMVRHVVDDVSATSDVLARACASALRGSDPGDVS